MARRGVMALLVLSVVVASFAYPQAAQASTTWVWPGPAPCNTTLQACVTNAASGDTVLVAQSGAIAETIGIVRKSLTLSAQAGFQPTLNGASILNTSSGGATVNVAVSDIEFAQSVLVSLDQGIGNVVTLDHISAVSSGADPGVYATVYAESTINVLHSTFTEGGFYPGIELTSRSRTQTSHSTSSATSSADSANRMASTASTSAQRMQPC